MRLALLPCGLVLLVALLERLVAPFHAAPAPGSSAVLLSGASTGIGRHVAEALQRLGFRAARKKEAGGHGSEARLISMASA